MKLLNVPCKIHTVTAVVTIEPFRTLACIIVEPINTDTTILTATGCTVIYIYEFKTKSTGLLEFAIQRIILWNISVGLSNWLFVIYFRSHHLTISLYP